MNKGKERESDLLFRLKNRDSRAFELIYNDHWLLLFRIARKIVDDEAIAKDLIQDVFVSLWEKASLQQISNLSAYLTQAVKYSCFMHLRSGAISQKHLARLNALIESNTIEEEYNLKELQQALDQGIESLPEKCREVFCMSRFEYLPNQKIAEKLNISPKTVENQITKALRILRLSVDKMAFLLFFIQ